MRVNKRGLLLLILILVLLMSVASVIAQGTPKTVDSCRQAGGIWCDEKQGTSDNCQLPSTEIISKDIVCVVDSEQNIELKDTTQAIYSFKKFNLKENGKLSFSVKTAYAKSGAGKGGKGSSGCEDAHSATGSEAGEPGRPGGDGGAVLSKGQNGGSTNGKKVGSEGVTENGGKGGLPGANIKIYAKKDLTIKGKIFSVGKPGSNGGYPGNADNCNIFPGQSDDGACGGGGGAGGGGGGIITLAGFNVLVDENAILNVSGGNGGNGGRGGQDFDTLGHRENGGNGAPGAGGDGGEIRIQAQKKEVDPKTFILNPGVPGNPTISSLEKDCHASPGTSTEGRPGTSSTDARENDPESTGSSSVANAYLCSDSLDNDFDGLIDMDDPDCHDATDENSQASISKWDTKIWSYLNLYTTPYSWYNASANDGTDMVCGDDYNVCTFKNYSSCDQIPKDSCNSYLGCGWKSGCTGTKCSRWEVQITGGIPSPVCAGEMEDCSSLFKDETSCKADFSDIPAGVGKVKTCTWSGTGSCSGDIVPCTSLVKDSCLEYPDVCKLNYPSASKDDGSIVYGGKYACFIDPDSFKKSDKYPNEQIFFWKDAKGSNIPYKIHQADNTQFVSNGKSWFYCDADGKGEYGSSGKISEGNSFENALVSGKRTCSSTISVVVASSEEFENPKIIDCELENYDACLVDAKDKYADSTDLLVVCAMDDKGNPANYDASKKLTDSDGFTSICGDRDYCAEYDQAAADWVNFKVDEFLDEEFKTFYDLCQKYPTLFGCSADSVLTKKTDKYVDQDYFNSPYAEEFMGKSYNSESTCQDIVKDSLGQKWHDKRVCDIDYSDGSGEICVNGLMVNSKETGGKSELKCCVGEDAYCEEYSDDLCIQMGFSVAPKDADEVYCSGRKIGSSCCTGSWITDPATFFANQAQNDSFICYKRQNLNLLQECCDVGGTCFNRKDNPLNKYQFDNELYSFAGVPLNTIKSFDSYDDGQKTKILTGENNEAEVNIPRYTNFSTFTDLVFDFVLNNKNLKKVMLVDGAGKKITYSDIDSLISIHKSLLKPNRMSLPLTTKGKEISKDTEFSMDDVKKLRFIFSESEKNIELWIDNIHLEDTSGKNTETYYCSGPFKSWVKNLDGPTDSNEGFYYSKERGTDDGLDIKKYGEYKYACDAQAPFAWTGSLCCGDDSREGYGEYWIDDAGMCWNGTYVTNDQNLAYNKGEDLIMNENERSILFYGNYVSICDKDESVFNNYFLSFGKDRTKKKLNEGISNIEEVSSFTVRGSWICEKGGTWTRIKDFNRIRIILAVFLDAAKKMNDYTIFCGNSSDVRNSFDIQDISKLDTYEDLTKNACLFLDLGQKPDKFDNTYFGLEVKQGISVEEYSKSILKQFNPLSNYDIDCSSVPKNPGPENFFTSCKVLNEDKDKADIQIYYNAPFNLVIIGSDRLKSDNVDTEIGFFPNLWDAIVDFFNGLFIVNDDYKLTEDDLASHPGIKEYYATKRVSDTGTKIIRGLKENIYGRQHVRVDYNNLSNSVKFLADAFKSQNKESNVLYVAENYTQTIFVNADDSTPINWKTLTSIIRLNDKGTRKNFGENICGDGKVGISEECDGSNLGQYTNCADYKPDLYVSGDLVCLSDCKLGEEDCVEKTTDSAPKETCSDGKKNQDETDVDCGGTCSSCAEGKTCKVDDDCSTGLICNSATNRCQLPASDSCETPCISEVVCKEGMTCYDGCCIPAP